MTWKASAREELNRFDARIVMVFAITCVVIVSYQYFSRLPLDLLLERLAGGKGTRSYYQSISWHLGSFFMLFVVPLAAMGLLNRFSLRKLSPLRYTFALGDYKAGLKLVLLFVGVAISIHLMLVLLGVIPPDGYPACKSRLIRESVLFFILFEFSQCLYMLSFEYFFRGFALIEAEAVFGDNALAVTLLPYIMIKLGKPPVEIYTAILVGIALAYMTIRTRSFWYAALSHCLLATMVDVMAVAFW